MNEGEKGAKHLKKVIQARYALDDEITQQLTESTVVATALLTQQGLSLENDSNGTYFLQGCPLDTLLPDPAHMQLYQEVYAISKYAANALFQELFIREVAKALQTPAAEQPVKP